MYNIFIQLVCNMIIMNCILLCYQFCLVCLFFVWGSTLYLSYRVGWSTFLQVTDYQSHMISELPERQMTVTLDVQEHLSMRNFVSPEENRTSNPWITNKSSDALLNELIGRANIIIYTCNFTWLGTWVKKLLIY